MSDSNQKQNNESQFLAIFAADSAQVKQFGDSLSRLGYSSDRVFLGGVETAESWVKEHAIPSLLFVDIDNEVAPLVSISALLELCGPTCKIVAFGSEQSIDLYRALLSNGVFDYLLKPIPLDMISAVIQRAEKGKVDDATTGRTIAVTGTSGGVGASLVSLGLAQSLSTKRHMMTALVDFDRKNGSLGLMLGYNGDAGLGSALSAENIDARLLGRSIGKVDTRLSLVAQVPDFHAEELTDSYPALVLGSSLCRMFNQVIWDLPSAKPFGSMDVLAHAQTRIIVTDFTVTDARNTLRLLNEIGDESSGQRILLVRNSSRHMDKEVISQKEFEEFIGRKIDMVLPYAGSGLGSSLLQGKLSLEAFPDFALGLLNLADLACGKVPQQSIKKTSAITTVLRRLFKTNKSPEMMLKGGRL
ncbi:histidine kinase [Marinomonas lutimaris]|uniref:histidine kinase n=1 Tax=Marinomonas lutimaris TaxID=2846746 RepID=UPI001CA5CCEE|nr:histidine kinase [Marinomonas lutimaris]